MQPNVLMCRYVCELLPPTRQAHLRSAGSLGYDAFEELVALGDVPAYVEVVADEGGDARLGALMNVPIRGVKKPMRRRRKIPKEYVIVFWEKAMRRRGIPEPNWPHLPWTSIRFNHDSGASPSADGHRTPTDWLVMWGSSATYIELRGLDALEETPSGMLENCNAAEVDMSSFRDVRVIGDWFMRCANTSVDFFPFSQVHTIKNAFLQVYQPHSIDFWPFRNVVTIGDFFLTNTMLESIDLSPFAHNLKSIGDSFMASSVNLQEIDLAPLSKVTKIGSYFFVGSRLLSSIDLSPLESLLSLGRGCLSACTGLHTVLLPTFDSFSDIVIGKEFLSSCYGLKDLDLSPWHNMTSIPGEFLCQCTGLTHLDLTPFTSVTSVKFGFLSQCSGLIDIDLSPLRNVRPPLLGFMDGCTGIAKIDMSPLVLLTETEREEALRGI